jgi:hypothetical protein
MNHYKKTHSFTKTLIAALLIFVLSTQTPILLEQNYFTHAISSSASFSTTPSNPIPETVASTQSIQNDPQSESIELPVQLQVLDSNDPIVSFNRIGNYTGQWSVNFEGMRPFSSTSTITFTNVPNGTYYYTVQAESATTVGWIASPSSGYVTVNGSSVTVDVTFTGLPTVSFNRAGGYSGQWSVSLEGMRSFSSTSTISFSNVPNGTYYYTIYPETSARAY